MQLRARSRGRSSCARPLALLSAASPLLLLLLVPSVLAATHDVTLFDPSGRLPPTGFSAFVGSSIVLTLDNPQAVASPNLLFVAAKCDAALAVTPSVQCLTQTRPAFTVVPTKPGAIAKPCTFDLVGDADVAAQYSVGLLNSVLASWTIKQTEALQWDELSSGATPANPMLVQAAQYSFNFSRASGGHLEHTASCSFTPQCNDEIVSWASGGQLTATGGAVALSFNNQGRTTNNAMCAFQAVCSNSADTFRYSLPSLYFRVGLAEDAQQRIEVQAPAAGFQPSATVATTHVLRVPTPPVLRSHEWLVLRVASCASTSGAGQGDKVTPGLGAFGAADSASKRWGVFASANAGPTIVLPPFVAGALHAECSLVLEGSSDALLRYTLASHSISLSFERKVVLTPTFDGSSWSHSGEAVVIGANTPRVRFVPDQAVEIGELSVAVSCGECDGANSEFGTGFVALTGHVTASGDERTSVVGATAASVRFPSRAHDPNITASPFYDFQASSSFTSERAAVQQTCYYSLEGDDAAAFQLANTATTFRLLRQQTLSMTANNGLVSPLFSVDAASGSPSFNGYTPTAIPPARARDTVVTLQVPVGHELQVGFNCSLFGVDTASVSADGGAFVSSRLDGSQMFVTVGFERTTPASAVAHFYLPTTVPQQTTPGQLVHCTIRLWGRDAPSFYAPPTPLSFHVGTPVQLSAAVQSASVGDGVYRSTASSGAVSDVNRVYINLTAPADATVYNSAPRLAISCLSDVQATDSDNKPIFLDDGTPSYKSVSAYDANSNLPLTTASFAVGAIGQGRRFYVLLDDPAARRVRCTYSFQTTSASRDQRRFLAPPPTVIAVQPAVSITPAGNIVSTSDEQPSANRFARLAPGATATLTLTPSEQPIADEKVDVTINCSADLTPTPIVYSLTRSSPSASWSFTAPPLSDIPAGTGRLYTCRLRANSTWGGKFALSSSSFLFAVGEVAQWQASETLVSLYPSMTSVIRFTPSSCRAAMTLAWTCTMASPITGQPVALSTFGGSTQVALDATTDVYSLTLVAPNPATHSAATPLAGLSYDVTCRVSSVNYVWSLGGYSRPFATPSVVVFRVLPRATFEFVGLRDLGANEDTFQFAVRPTVAPSSQGVQVRVRCIAYNDATAVGTAADAYLFWFAGSSEPQSVTFTKPSANTNGYKCRISVDSQSQLSDDGAHFDGSANLSYRIGTPVGFTVSTESKYVAATRCSRGITKLSMQPTAPLLRSTSVRLVCARADNFAADGTLKSPRATPDVRVYTSDPASELSFACSGSSCQLTFDPSCGVASAQPFWIVNEAMAGQVYTGEVRCSYTTPSQPFTAGAIADTRNLYTGVTPPNDDGDDDGLSDGAIAGIVIGSLIGAGLLAGAAYMAMKSAALASQTGAPRVAPSSGAAVADASGQSSDASLQKQQQQQQQQQQHAHAQQPASANGTLA